MYAFLRLCANVLLTITAAVATAAAPPGAVTAADKSPTKQENGRRGERASYTNATGDGKHHSTERADTC